MARKSKFTEAQIVGFLKEVEAGGKLVEVARRSGFGEQSFYRWKAKYGGMEVSDAQEKRRLEDENRKLKQIVADLSLDNHALKAALGKKW